MSKDKFSLPFEYQQQPEFFDAFNLDENTDAKNSVIEKLLNKHRAKTVLDLTCGTGSQVFFLAKRGYEVVGSDFSPTLIKMAKKRARKEKISLKFIDGDMRNVKVGEFDAVITIFNAVGHLTKAGFEKAMRNIHGNLKQGGVYIFDILNLEAMTDSVVANLAHHTEKQIGATKVHKVQCCSIDRNTGHLTNYDMCVFQKNADKPIQINNKFILQIYTAEQLREMLDRSGFETVDQYSMDGSKFMQHKTTSILNVARKR